MRALSVKQPYAEQIARGDKRIEYRTWPTSTGPLLIVASTSRERINECRAARIDPESIVYGKTVCTVNVVAVRKRRDRYEWVLEDVTRVEPVHVRGNAAIYHVSDELIRPQASGANARPAKAREPVAPGVETSRPETGGKRMPKHAEWKPEAVFEVNPGGDAFKPYDHQLAAWDALTKHFVGEGARRAGLLVVPTGGGKTAIAARWLLQNHVAKGGRVLWFAHRRSLLRQAFNTFAGAANLAAATEEIAGDGGGGGGGNGGGNGGKSELRLITVSSQDRSWSNVAASHDVVFSSVQSAVVEKNFGFLDLMKTQSPNGLFVVVDEAHHAAAPGYQRVVLRELKERLGCPVLGLSATPVRMDPNDAKRLWALFEQIVYQVDKQRLFNLGILAQPAIENVKTGLELEKEFTQADRDHLARFGELSDRVLEALAKHAGRNKLIVEHYLKKKDAYGSTIVFGANIHHAQTLAQEFKTAGVDADFVDYSRGDALGVMESYRDARKPAVLCNVEMLTEGFDAPHTKTVFIVRPTRSEALVAQMVGRALRGPKAGGNATANLVTFVDTWKDFSVLDTEYVVAEGPPEDAPAGPPRISPVLIPISDELVREAYRLVQSAFRGVFMGVHQCLPYGWFVWEQELENDIQRRLILVFENQREGFERLRADFASGANGSGGAGDAGGAGGSGGSRIPIPADLSEAFATDLRRRYFADVPDPLPRWTDLQALLGAWRSGLDVGFYTFEDKKAFDPQTFARRFYDENVPPKVQNETLRRVFDDSAACRLVYKNDFRAFFDEVQDALKDVINKPSPPEHPKMKELSARKSLRTWDPGENGYSLVQLRDAVLAQPRHFPKGAPLVRELSFSERPMANLFGYFRNADRKLAVNCTLNSPDVPRFVMEFLVYHELLHADMPSSGHNPDFRQREQRFVPSPAAVADATGRGLTPGKSQDAWRVLADQFLDTLTHHFDVPRMAL